MKNGKINLKQENVSLTEMLALLKSAKYVNVEEDGGLLRVIGRNEEGDVFFRTVKVNEEELNEFCEQVLSQTHSELAEFLLSPVSKDFEEGRL